MSLELKQLYYLKTCAETKSFTRAAAALYTSQSNVSKVIHSLEDELGVVLFERQQYGIALTKQGEKIYTYALHTLDSAQKLMDYADTGHAEELRICANPGFWMARTFARYYGEWGTQDVQYSYLTEGTEEIIHRLAERQDQLGFIYVMEDQLPYLQWRLSHSHLYFTPLTTVREVLYSGTAALPVDQGEAIDLVQGVENEFALRSYRRDREKQEDDPEIRHICVTTNSDYVISELLNHTRLCYISGGQPDGRTQEGDLTQRSLFAKHRSVIFGFLARDDGTMDPQAIKFLKYVRQEIKKGQAEAKEEPQ